MQSKAPAPSAIVINHLTYDDPGAFRSILDRAGYSYSYSYREFASFPASLRGVGLVVSLGSKWSANSEADNPEIVEELRFLERAVSAEVPTIGVCFGAQLLARLLGSEIVDMPVPKEGWISTPLKSADLATEDLDLFYWNEQGFAAPPDAIELSVSDGYCNLFQVGSTVGAQFHADVTQDLLRRWVADVAGERTEDPRNTWLKRSDGFANTQVIAETLCGRLDHGLSAN